MVSVFGDEDVRDAFQGADFKLTRAAFASQTLWDTSTERTIPRFDRGREQRGTCANSQETMGMWLDLHELEKVHGAPDTHQGRNHGIKSPLRVSVLTNQCATCGSSQIHPPAQDHVVS